MKKTAKTYKFPYAKDSEGYPEIKREMTPEQYEEYKAATSRLLETIKENASKPMTALEGVTIGVQHERMPLIWQNSDECKAIPYPAEGFEGRTVATSGEFPIVAYMLLKYFGKECALEDLVRIALWGDWHHANGTWHHYLDVVCQAYDLKISRISSLEQVENCMERGGVSVALLDNSLFPGARGNVLSVIISLDDLEVFFYSPRNPEGRLCLLSAAEFLKHTKVLWGVRPYISKK